MNRIRYGDLQFLDSCECTKFIALEFVYFPIAETSAETPVENVVIHLVGKPLTNFCGKIMELPLN